MRDIVSPIDGIRSPFGPVRLRPEIRLNFLSGTLDPRITFSRPSLATLYDSTGKLTYAPNNLLTYSDTPSNPAWFKTSSTVSGNIVSFTGTPGAFQQIGQNISTTPQPGDAFIWAAQLSGSGTVTMDGNAFIGSVLCTLSSTPTWFFVKIAYSSGFAQARIISYPGNTATGVTVHNTLFSRVTYETSIRPSDQVTTVASAYYGPRFDYNPATLAARGLLIEEARTNIVTYSQDVSNVIWKVFNTGAAKVGLASDPSPDGTLNAYEVSLGTVGGTFNGASAVYNDSVSVTAGSNYTASIWVRAKTGSTTVRVGMQIGAPYDSGDVTVGTTWQRISVTSSSPAPSSGPGNISIRTNVAGTSANVFIYGAQLEAGSFATSYIPTAASSVARSADSASMTGTNFSSWYNQAQGTFVILGDVFGAIGSQLPTFVNVNDTTLSNYIRLNASSTYRLRQFINTGGSQQTQDTTGSAPVLNQQLKVGAAYNLNDFAIVADGGAATVDTAGTVPTVTQINFGVWFSSAGTFLNGHIASITYYNTRLPNTKLQSLTT